MTCDDRRVTFCPSPRGMYISLSLDPFPASYITLRYANISLTLLYMSPLLLWQKMTREQSV
jgi:hypothetical protein